MSTAYIFCVIKLCSLIYFLLEPFKSESVCLAILLRTAIWRITFVVKIKLKIKVFLLTSIFRLVHGRRISNHGEAVILASHRVVDC